jgi:predicted PurR-regulated permease PerM
VTIPWRVIVWLTIFAAFITALVLLREILFPFVAGLAVAYFLDPVCDRLERMGLSRIWATVAVTVGFFVLVILVLALLAPLLYGQVVQFLDNLPRYVGAIEQKAAPLIETVQRYVASDDAQVQVKQFLGANLGDVTRFLIQFLANLVSGLEITFNLFSLFLITPIVAFYQLRDWDRIVARVDSWLPRAHAATIREQAALIDETLAAFVRGQLSVCVLLGVFYGIGLSLVGLDFGLVVGLATGLVSFVPYFGMLIGFALGLGLAIAQFDTVTPIILVAGVFILGQIVEGNFVTPKLVGDKVNLHAVWVIFALLAGGALFGFVGLLLAIPAAAAIGVLVRFCLSRYMRSGAYLGAGRRAAKKPAEDT